jgi:DNA repair exonuclease SbcCD ATPase subunit
MRLHALKLREFRRFQALDVTFAAGVTVVGGGNGCGKSSLLEGIVWALYGAGTAGHVVRRSEESLRRQGAPGDIPTSAELAFSAGPRGERFLVRRSFTLEADGPAVTAALLRDDGSLLAAGADAVNESMAALLGAGREAWLHACVTGRRELQQLAQLRPVDRLRTLARLLGRSVSRRSPMDQALLEAVQALEAELAEADERIAALHTAPDLLVQYSRELEMLRLELADAEAAADRLQDEWSQKRQDVDTRLLATRRRLEEVQRQVDRLAGSGASLSCPTCQQPLAGHADALAARLDDEFYTLTQDAKWLTQRQAQLVRRPPDLMEAEARRNRLRAAVDDRTERAARCEQATQELWTVAGDRKRAAERLDHLRQEPAVQAAGSVTPPLSGADLKRVAGLAADQLRQATEARYDAIQLLEDGRVYALHDGVAAPVVSGADEDLLALVLRFATMRLAAEEMPGLELVLLDEPFGSMDTHREGRVMALLRQMAADGTQVILATARPGAAAHADLVLHPGG